jgi:hypothetical protein
LSYELTHAHTRREDGCPPGRRTAVAFFYHGFAQTVHPDACPTAGFGARGNAAYAGKNWPAFCGQHGLHARGAAAGTTAPGRTGNAGGGAEHAGRG